MGVLHLGVGHLIDYLAMMLEIDDSNPFFQLALRFVSQTCQPIFLTGKAGTGKTTFLKWIKENSFKKMAVVAPTGVAAINAGGVTAHSFFQLPFGPFIPAQDANYQDSLQVSNEHNLIKNIRFNQAKRELLNELDLLVIDEVSMLRADMLDAIDCILRHFRRQPSVPFGALQVLYIGDLFQLPPVVNKAEWEILRPYYKSPFFFDARALQQAPPVYLELKKIYRQNDARFIGILNNIRTNQSTAENIRALEQHYDPEFQPAAEDNFIVLTTHNARADLINRRHLNKLDGEMFSFDATVRGDFDEKAFPAEKKLYLKREAQVMFIKNDKGENRRYFNGKIGIVSNIQADEIIIRFPGEQQELTLEKETWKNIRYQFNKTEGRIEEETIGEFTQYPLRLAWAITIHKSQGLTFNKAIIDAGASFAPGQVYVALSRLTGMEGLILHSRIDPGCIFTDQRVLEFSEREMAEDQLLKYFKVEQKAFAIRCLYQSFSWEKLTAAFHEHNEGYEQRQLPAKQAEIIWGAKLLDTIRLQDETSLKFSRQLDQLLEHSEEDGYAHLQQRVSAACDYFIPSVDAVLASIQEHIDQIKTRQKIKKYTKDLKDLQSALLRKKQQLQYAMQIAAGLWRGTDMDKLLQMSGQQRQQGSSTKEEPLREEITHRPKKGETHRISLRLFREKKDIQTIATLRGLAPVTIENHLVSFIPTGEIEITELVSPEKMGMIIKAIGEDEGKLLTPIKERLGDGFSYIEIKAAMKYREGPVRSRTELETG